VHRAIGELNETDIFCFKTLEPVSGKRCYSQMSHFFLVTDWPSFDVKIMVGTVLHSRSCA